MVTEGRTTPRLRTKAGQRLFASPTLIQELRLVVDNTSHNCILRENFEATLERLKRLILLFGQNVTQCRFHTKPFIEWIPLDTTL